VGNLKFAEEQPQVPATAGRLSTPQAAKARFAALRMTPQTLNDSLIIE
jgi:hypothetical protein